MAPFDQEVNYALSYLHAILKWTHLLSWLLCQSLIAFVVRATLALHFI
jgi:hypothetical protein